MPGLTFAFSQTHTTYKQMLGWTTSSAPIPTKRVLIVDSGIDSLQGYTIVDRKNFLDVHNQQDVTDEVGHGTAIASIINDLCPNVELVIYKIANASKKVSEWDLLAALDAWNGADIVNLSIAYGFTDRVCGTCGRVSGRSRATVFERLLDQLRDSVASPLLVAAAGNDGADELYYPSRFNHVIAVESIDSSHNLSAFSNWSTTDQEHQTHPAVFVLPGGQRVKGQPATEVVGQSANGGEYWGTSFATAYAVGLIAAVWSQPIHTTKSRTQMLDHLKATADTSFPNYAFQTYGHGMMHF